MAGIQSEIERVAQQLANRVKTLDDRYAQPLPEILKSVAELSAKVEGHLQKMGIRV